MTRVFDMMRARSGGDMARRYTYRKMTPAEISAALQRTGLSVGQFSRIIGARYNGPDDSTVQKWLNGRQDAPTYLPALLAVLALPGAVERARLTVEMYLEVDDG